MLSSALALVISFSGALTSATAEPVNPPFRLIQTRNSRTLQRDLRSAAQAGYRVLGATPGSTLDGKPLILVLMQRDPPAGGPVEYAVFAPSGDLDDETARSRMNALGNEGYRLAPGRLVTRRVEDFWLPQAAYEAQLTLILERCVSPRRFAYDVIRFDDFETFQHNLATRRAEGYEVLALVNSARRLRAVLARPLEAGAPDGEPREYRLLMQATNRGLRRALKRAGSRGYRAIAAADASIHTPAMVLVEKGPAAPAIYAYRVLDDPVQKQRRGKLETKLNRHGSEGYRVVPGGSTESALLLELAPGTPARTQYRAIASRDPPGLPRALEQATGEGYRFVTMLADSDGTIVLLEK